MQTVLYHTYQLALDSNGSVVPSAGQHEFYNQPVKGKYRNNMKCPI